jgi:DNA-directed RNA polymerase specialized sigma24 family protein
MKTSQGISFQHHMEDLPMNPYRALQSENEWPKAPFLIHEDLLVSAAVAGHDEAFVELCRRTSGRAFGAIYRITQNRKDARDVFQEAISIALLHLNQFKLDSSFSTWFTRIGINCALMLRRRRRTRAENPAAHPIINGSKPLPPGSRPFAHKSRSAVSCSIQIL